MSKKLRSPILWMGGKHNLRNKILPVLNSIPHKHYVEAFGGGASLLIAKPQVEIETYNDINSDVYDFFKVISDKELFNQFYEIVYLLPHSRKLFLEYRDTWRLEKDLVKRVAKWYLVIRQAFAGTGTRMNKNGTPNTNWKFAVNNSINGFSMATSSWLSILDLLPYIHERLRGVQIENSDFRRILKNYDSKTTLFYLDPPYVISTRKSGDYINEMTDKDHKELIDLVLNLKASVVVSGYDNDIYTRLDQNGFIRKEFNVACYNANAKNNNGVRQRRTEVLWIKSSE